MDQILILRVLSFLIFSILALTGLMYHYAGVYVELMYDGKWSDDGKVEAWYYAAQTATTVGYGNWIPEKKSDDPKSRYYDQRLKDRVMEVKAASFWFMLLTAPLLSLIIGIAVSLVFKTLE